MLSSPFFRQGITELACKQGKNSDEVKEFSEGYASQQICNANISL